MTHHSASYLGPSALCVFRRSSSSPRRWRRPGKWLRLFMGRQALALDVRIMEWLWASVDAGDRYFGGRSPKISPSWRCVWRPSSTTQRPEGIACIGAGGRTDGKITCWQPRRQPDFEALFLAARLHR